MGQLIVRNIEEEEVVLALKRRAARHGRSAEAEHRGTLGEVLARDEYRESFREFLESMPEGLTDEDLRRQDDMPRDVEL